MTGDRDKLPWTRQGYEQGGWNDGRIGQAYDCLSAALKDRGENIYKHPLLDEIEALDGPKPSDADTYRGWTISYSPTPIPARDFDWIAQGPNFDASYEGPEDGWVGNGEQVHASSRDQLISEIDAWFEEGAA